VAAEPGAAEGCEGAAAALGILPAWFGEVRDAYADGGWEWEAQQPLTLRRCLGATEGVFGTKGVAALQCELFDLFLHYVADPLERRRKEIELWPPAKTDGASARRAPLCKQRLTQAQARRRRHQPWFPLGYRFTETFPEGWTKAGTWFDGGEYVGEVEAHSWLDPTASALALAAELAAPAVPSWGGLKSVFLLEVCGCRYFCNEASNRRRASAYRRRLTRPRQHVDVGSSSESQKREAMRSHESQSAKFPCSSLSGKQNALLQFRFRKTIVFWLLG
jgi:hypothetical protein